MQCYKLLMRIGFLDGSDKTKKRIFHVMRPWKELIVLSTIKIQGHFCKIVFKWFKLTWVSFRSCCLVWLGGSDPQIWILGERVSLFILVWIDQNCLCHNTDVSAFLDKTSDDWGTLIQAEWSSCYIPVHRLMAILKLTLSLLSFTICVGASACKISRDRWSEWLKWGQGMEQ